MVTRIKLSAKRESYLKPGSFFRVLPIGVRCGLKMHDLVAVSVALSGDVVDVSMPPTRLLFAGQSDLQAPGEPAQYQ